MKQFGRLKTSPTDRAILLVATALFTPGGYLLYLLVVRSRQGVPLRVEPIWSPGMVSWFVVLAAIGVVVALGLERGLWLPLPAALGGLLLLPFTSVSVPIGGDSHVLIPFVFAVLAGAWEMSVRSRRRLAAYLVEGRGRLALLAGFGHLVFGGCVQIAVRGYDADRATAVTALTTDVWVLSLAGLVLSGAIPVALWLRRGLKFPLLAAATWALVGSARVVAASPLPVSEARGMIAPGSAPILPVPGVDYLFSSPTLLVLLVLAAAIEDVLRSKSIGSNPPGSSETPES